MINNYLSKIEDLKTGLSEKCFSLEAELDKTRALEDSLLSISNETTALKGQISELEDTSEKMKSEHQIEVIDLLYCLLL